MELPLPILIGLVLTGGLWTLVLALRLPTLYAGIGCMIAASCLGYEFGHWQVGPVHVSVDRLMIVAVIAICGSKHIFTKQPSLRFDGTDGALLALLVFLFWSMHTRVWVKMEVPDAPPLFRWLFGFAAPALIFWTTRFRVWSGRDFSVVAGFLVAFGLYLCVTGLGEVYDVQWLVFPRYILETRTMTNFLGRARGPFLESAVMGMWLTLATVAAILLASRSRGIPRVLLWLVVPLFAFVEYLTKTRSAWLGFIVAVPFVLHQANRRLPRITVVSGMVGVLLIGAMIAGREFVAPTRDDGPHLVEYSRVQRISLVQQSLNLFVQHPVLGWGFGQFERAHQQFGGIGPFTVMSSDAANVISAHNLPLRLLADSGVVGAGLFAAVLVGWTRRAKRVMAAAPAESAERSMALLFLAAMISYVSLTNFTDVTWMLIGHLTLFFLAGCLSAAPVPQLAPRMVAHRRHARVPAPSYLSVAPVASSL